MPRKKESDFFGDFSSLPPIAAEYDRSRKLGQKVEKPSWPEFARKTFIRSGKELIPFDPFDLQLQLHTLVSQYSNFVVPKTRQLGLTEYIASYCLWRAYRDPSFLAVIFSKRQTDSSDIAKRVKMMAASHPDVEMEGLSMTDIQLKDGGRLMFQPSTPNAARGVPSAHAIIYDECAFVDKIEEIFGSAQASTSLVPDAKTFLISTPNGCSGFFWDYCSSSNGGRDFLQECQRAREEGIRHWQDEDGWIKYLVHWKAHPIYSKNPNYLADIQRKYKLPKSRVLQEFDLNFLIDNRTLISRDWLEYYYPSQNDSYERIIQSWDTAATDKKSSAYWACSTWGIKEGDYYLLDCYWEKHQYASGFKAVQSQQQKWKPHLVLIEEKSTGITLLQELPKSSYFTSSVKGIQPKGSKEERLEAESPAIESGRVVLPLNAPWLYQVEEMLVEFPDTEIKDVVDSISQFLHWVRIQDHQPSSHWKRRSIFSEV